MCTFVGEMFYISTYIHTLIFLFLPTSILLPLLRLPVANYYKSHKLCAIIVNIADLMLKRFRKSEFKSRRWGKVTGTYIPAARILLRKFCKVFMHTKYDNVVTFFFICIYICTYVNTYSLIAIFALVMYTIYVYMYRVNVYWRKMTCFRKVIQMCMYYLFIINVSIYKNIIYM